MTQHIDVTGVDSPVVRPAASSTPADKRCPKCGGAMAVSNVLTTVSNAVDSLVFVCLDCRHRVEVQQ